RNVALDGKPVVREITQRGIDADGAGVEDGRAEPIPGDSKTQLPAEIIAPTEDKPRLGLRWFGVGGSKRTAGSIRRARAERHGIQQGDSRRRSVGEINGRRSG